jgi:DHA2 family multidrug resistance protein
LHWVFFANVPFGILNMLLVALFIFDPSYFQKRKVHIDYWGLVLLVVGLGALQIMLQKGEEENWFESALIQRLAITSFVGITLFIIWELIAKSPAVNLRILKNINLSVGTFIGGILGVGLYGSLFLLPRLLQQLLGYPAFNSGVALIPRAIAMAIAMPLAGLLYNRLKVKLIAFGLILSIISFFQLSHLNLSVDYWAIFLPQFLQGLGFGFIFVPLSTTAFITIEKPLLTAATGLYNVVRQVAGSVGTAIAATGISAGMNHYRAMIVEHVNVYNNITSDRLTLFQDVLHQRGSSSFTAEAQAYKLLERTVNTQSSMLAYNRVFFVILCLFLVSLFLLVLFRKQKS